MHQNLAQQEMDQEKEPFACRYGCVCGQEEEDDDDDTSFLWDLYYIGMPITIFLK